MACGNPCVATDVGDARWIIGQNGGIVPPGEPEALADALIALYDIGSEARQRLGEKARQRIIRDFSLPEIARQYEALYDRVLDRAAAAQTVSPLSNDVRNTRSEEHTSELQSLMRISYAVFCLKKNKN